MAFLALFVALSGCKQDPPRTTLRLTLQQEANAVDRSLVPVGIPLEVTHYIVEGIGPSDSTFSVDSDKPNIEIEGLLSGTWNLHAIGQNSTGVDLVEGNATCKLGEVPANVVIQLDSLKGTGTMDITFQWDPDKISSPSIVLSVTGPDGTKTTVEPTVNNIANGSVSYSSYYPAGSYTVQARLYSGSIAMAGAAQVVRIVGNKITEGSVLLDLEDVPDIPGSITLVNKAGTPIECTIDGLSPTMDAQQEATATLDTENLGETEGLDVTWYLDGQTIGTGMTCTFTPASGMHRLDVIARGSLLGSDGSASFPFVAEVSGSEGIPIVLAEIGDGDDGTYSSGDTQVAFLPDGNLLVSSTTHKTLQVCRIVRDSIEVLHSYDTTDGFNTAKIADILVDFGTCRVAVADNEYPGIGVYQYDPDDATLTKLFYRDNTKYVRDNGEVLYFDALGSLALDESDGTLYSTVPSSPDIPMTYLYAADAANATLNNYVYLFPNPYVEISGMAISEGNNKAALFSTPDGVLKLCTRDSMGYLVSNDQNFGIDTTNPTPYLDGISSVAFIDDSNVVCGNDQALCRFTTISSLDWKQADIWLSGQDGIGEMDGIDDLVVDSEGSMVYAICSDSKNINCFSVDQSTGYLSFEGATSLGSFVPSEAEISPDKEHMVVASGISNRLLLCRIP
jgi:hypothetical protein